MPGTLYRTGNRKWIDCFFYYVKRFINV